jgi:hypothetical protein
VDSPLVSCDAHDLCLGLIFSGGCCFLMNHASSFCITLIMYVATCVPGTIVHTYICL